MTTATMTQAMAAPSPSSLPFEQRIAMSYELFIAKEQLDRLDAQRLRGPADLAIEIISPESTSRDRAEKLDEYQAGGVHEYWVIDVRPGQERTDFWLLDASGRYRASLPDANGIVHAAVLPGFWLDVAWLWQQPLPSALAVFAEIADLPDSVRRILQPRS